MRFHPALFALALTAACLVPCLPVRAQQVEVGNILVHRLDGGQVQDPAPHAIDYARAIEGLSNVVRLLPRKKAEIEKADLQLVRDAETLFSNYDGRAIPDYSVVKGTNLASPDVDASLQGFLAQAFSESAAIQRDLSDGDGQHRIEVASKGEPVKGLNYVRANLYANGRFYADPRHSRVTAGSTAGGLRYLTYLVQTYDQARGMETQKFRRLRRFLGVFPDDLLSMIEATDRDLASRWDARLGAYRFGQGEVVYPVDDAAALILGHAAMAEFLTESGRPREAQQVQARAAALFHSCFVEGRTFSAHGMPEAIRVTAAGPQAEDDRVDVAAYEDAVTDLTAWAPHDPTVQRIDALALASAPQLASGSVMTAATDFRSGRILDDSGGAAVGAYLNTASALMATASTPIEQAFLLANESYLVHQLDRRQAFSATQDDPTPPHDEWPIPDWLSMAIIIGVAGTVFAFIDIYWPRKRFPITTKLIFSGVGVMILVTAIATRSLEFTRESRFCATCHVIRSKFETVFDPNTRTLAAKHYKNDWIKADGHECYECHTRGPGINGEIRTFYIGAKEVGEYLTGMYKVPIEIKVNINNNCLACHHRSLDPSFNSEDYHMIFRWQLAHAEEPCYGCHTFHTDEVLKKGIDFRLMPPHKVNLLPPI